jgi:hypothetical protein
MKKRPVAAAMGILERWRSEGRERVGMEYEFSFY